MTSETPVRSVFKVASLPISLCIGVVLGVFICALFGQPGIGVAVGAALGLSVGVSLSAAFLVSFFVRERE